MQLDRHSGKEKLLETSASTHSVTSTLGRFALPVNIAQLDCVTCTAAGHRCESTHTDLDGKPVCVFCLDEVPCPIAKRKALPVVQNLAPAPAPAPKRKPAMTTKAQTGKLTNSASSGIRRCPAPSKLKDPDSPPCAAVLRPTNRSGFCHLHFHLSKRKHPLVRPAATVDAAGFRWDGNHHLSPTKRSNGHTSQINLSLTEDQLTALFLRLPVVERAAIVSTWLTGGR
jgi:hypothetical protein